MGQPCFGFKGLVSLLNQFAIFTKCHGGETRSSRARNAIIFKAQKHRIFSPVLTTPQLSTHLGPSSNPSQTSSFTIKWS